MKLHNKLLHNNKNSDLELLSTCEYAYLHKNARLKKPLGACNKNPLFARTNNAS